MLFSDLLWVVADGDFEGAARVVAEAECFAQLRLVQELIVEVEKYEGSAIPKDVLLAVLREEKEGILLDLELMRKQRLLPTRFHIPKVREAEAQVKQP